MDQRSDFYSLAAVAYFVLLGETPFPGGTPEQVLARQTADRFPALHAARPDVPPALESVLQRALRNEVEARYPSAAEFLQALQRAMGRKVRERSGEWARAAAALVARERPAGLHLTCQGIDGKLSGPHRQSARRHPVPGASDTPHWSLDSWHAQPAP